MMNINEPQHYGYMGPRKHRATLICSSFFVYAKIAGTHKSGPAVGKEKGCSCEIGLAHNNTSHKKIMVIIIQFRAKCNH